jgi:hypothetical protein
MPPEGHLDHRRYRRVPKYRSTEVPKYRRFRRFRRVPKYRRFRRFRRYRRVLCHHTTPSVRSGRGALLPRPDLRSTSSDLCWAYAQLPRCSPLLHQREGYFVLAKKVRHFDLVIPGYQLRPKVGVRPPDRGGASLKVPRPSCCGRPNSPGGEFDQGCLNTGGASSSTQGSSWQSPKVVTSLTTSHQRLKSKLHLEGRPEVK